MSDRLRWKIAHLMDRLPGQCWSGLVSWVYRHDTDDGWRSRLPWRPEQRQCSSGPDFDRNGCCYCGKFRDMSRPEVAAMFEPTKPADEAAS